MQVKQAMDWREWFDGENLQLRQRLRDICEHILLSGECDLARKAEEYLWRKAFYDIIHKMKQDKRNIVNDPSMHSVLSSHLYSAIGYYHCILVRLRNRYNLALHGALDWIGVPSLQEHHDVSPDQADWAFKACQRCLIYLGDISRYQADITAEPNYQLSERYYNLAILLNPEYGMPHNQIGTLKQTQSEYCEAAYHYMRCVVSSATFEGADENLKRVLEKSAQSVYTFQIEQPDNMKSSLKEQYVASFLALQEMLFGIKVISTDELAYWCQSVLNLFGMVLMNSLLVRETKPKIVNGTEANTSPSKNNLSVAIDDQGKIPLCEMTKMFAISIMDTIKLRAIVSDTLSAATAFTMTLLSRLMEFSAHYLQIHYPAVVLEEGKGSNGKDTDDHYTKMKKRIILNRRKRRRQRNRMNSLDSDPNESAGEGAATAADDDLSDLSEGEINSCDVSEELSEDSDSAVEEKSDAEEDTEVARINSRGGKVWQNGSITDSERKKLAALSKAGILLNKSNKVNQSKHFLSSLNGITDDLLMDGVDFLNDAADLLDDFRKVNKDCYLPSIKILLDFIRFNPDVLKMCGKTSPALWQSLATILNTLPSQKVIKIAVMYFSRRRRTPSWLHGELDCNRNQFQKRALSEDVALLGMPGFEELHRSMDLSWFRGVNNADLYQFALRVTYLRSFGLFIHASEDVPEFSYDESVQRFIFVPASPTHIQSFVLPQGFVPVPPQQEHVNKLESRNEMMKALAKQKLKFEVSELEKNLKNSISSPTTGTSAFLVLDCPALCRHLSLLRSLVKSAHFVVVVPNQVVAALDELKKFNPGARDAIKFLEDEVKHGNRWLVMQKEHETVDDSVIFANKKKRNRDIEEWRFLQVIKCCLYFSEQRAGQSDVTLLTSDGSPQGTKASMGSRTSPFALEVCKAKGIQVEPVVDFYKRWTARSGPP